MSWVVRGPTRKEKQELFEKSVKVSVADYERVREMISTSLEHSTGIASLVRESKDEDEKQRFGETSWDGLT